MAEILKAVALLVIALWLLAEQIRHYREEKTKGSVVLLIAAWVMLVSAIILLIGCWV